MSAGSSLAVLDRTLFQLGGMSVLKFVMEVERHHQRGSLALRDG